MATEMETGTEAELLDTYLFIIKLVAVCEFSEFLSPTEKDGRNSGG